MRFSRLALPLLLLAMTVRSAPGAAQALPPPVPNIQNPNPPGPSQDAARERMEKEMARKANQERQAQLKRDSDRLFKLATELKDSVDKSNQNTLSVEVIKKAEEIEKLAHSVKEKMKGN